jgi:MFS family permease
MAFVLVMSIFSGRRITATGTYRRFPIAGTAIMLVSLLLFSHLEATTPFWQIVIYMALMGIGMGMTMQVLLLVAQNSVDYAELGVATSLAAFGRSIGGAVGVAIGGTILSGRLNHNLASQVSKIPHSALGSPAIQSAIAKVHGGSVTASPALIKRMPLVVQHAVKVGFSDSLHVVFLASVPVAAIGVIGALLLKEVPLRGAGHQPALSEGLEIGESMGLPAPEELGELETPAVPTQRTLPPTKKASARKS